jgi:ATP-binding cassette subfamily B protein
MKPIKLILAYVADWLVLSLVTIAESCGIFLLYGEAPDIVWIIPFSQTVALIYLIARLTAQLALLMKQVKWLWAFWQPHRGWMALLAVMTLLSSAVAIAYPYTFKVLIDTLEKTLATANPEIAHTTTWKLVWIFAVVGLARSLTNLSPGIRAMINLKLGMDIRRYYFSAIIEKGHGFFQKFRTGDLVTRLTDDIEGFPKIAWFACSGIFRAVESSSKFIFCMAVMLGMNWKLSLLSIAPLPIMLYIFYRLRIALGQRALQQQQIMSRTNDALEAAFSGVRILKAFTGETNQSNEFNKLLKERIGVEMNLTRLWMGVGQVYWGIQFVGLIIVVVAGGMMVVRNNLTPGEFYAFYIYLQILLQPLMDIPQLFVSSRQAFACIDREIEIEETKGGTEEMFIGTQPLGPIHDIEFKNVAFQYDPSLPVVLSDISLHLHEGEKVAIVGAVGSGKSTILKMAASLLPPTSGELLINGSPLSTWIVHDYRARVGYIPQESTLFSETVLDNIKFGRDIQDNAVHESLEMAQVRDEMMSLPGGVNQVLGQKGLTVSGGQKQRLAIARALVDAPDVLLMDDVTASLDAENERKFWAMFSARFPRTACLIVTHRLATARQADVIYVLHRGRVVGKGSHLELLETCEEYRNFLTRDELKAALGLSSAAQI